MKKEDFDEMKAFCNEKGFELLNVDHEDNEKFYVIAVKKDPWKGVEFAECVDDHLLGLSIKVGVIYKTRETDLQHCIAIEGKGGGFDKKRFKPSTEQAYIEQLKKEAFERFGIIKDADKFIIEGCSPTSALPFEKDWIYFKEVDILQHYGATIYQQGKWATKLPERVKVELLKMDCDKYNDRATKHTLKFLVSEEMVLSKEVGKFLAERLEKYLNDEIK